MLKTLFAALLLAHSWYPDACCGGRHCEPVKKSVLLEDGSRKVVTDSGVVVVVPNTMAPATSGDGRAHVCYIKEIWGDFRVRCYFEPGTA